jgi:hypothetical protein
MVNPFEATDASGEPIEFATKTPGGAFNVRGIRTVDFITAVYNYVRVFEAVYNWCTVDGVEEGTPVQAVSFRSENMTALRYNITWTVAGIYEPPP